MAKKSTVLFLCTGNSALSQMSEGLVNTLLSDNWEAASAGTEPAPEVNPFAIQALAELDIDITANTPKHINDFREETFDVVITLCSSAAGTCPMWLGKGHVEHIGFPDPAAVTGTDEEKLAAFRQVRDDIKEQVLGYLETFAVEAS